jgi:hypothetical protein
LICEYLREFLKKFEMILMSLSGAWAKVIHEKNLKQKISWHCPFKKCAARGKVSIFLNILRSPRIDSQPGGMDS